MAAELMADPAGSDRIVRRAKFLFIAASVLSGGQFTRGIFIVYMLSQGMSLAEVGIVESFFQIGRLLGEIPLGALADRWRRGRVIQVGYSLQVVATIMFVAGSGLWWYCIVFALLGARWAAKSGADTAMLYDFLTAFNSEADFARVSGRATAAGYVMIAVATFVGGLLLEINLWLPFLLEAGFMVCASILTGRFPECANSVDRAPRLRYRNTIVHALRSICKTRLLALFVLFTAVLEAGTTIVSVLAQSFFVDRGLSVPQATLVLGAAVLLSAVAAFYSHLLVRRGVVMTLLISTVAYIGGLLIMMLDFGLAAVIGYFLVFLNIDFFYPALRQFFNRLTTSSVRSTTLSFQSFLVSIATTASFPVATWIADRRGYDQLLIVICTVSAPLILGIVILSCLGLRSVPEESR
jgi:MFS family permease